MQWHNQNRATTDSTKNTIQIKDNKNHDGEKQKWEE